MKRAWSVLKRAGAALTPAGRLLWGIWQRHRRAIRAAAGLGLAALAVYILILREDINVHELGGLRQHAGWLLTGVVMIIIANLLAVPRWQMLLRAQGIHMPFWEAFRLTFVGYFFNFLLPGGTGGDVVKAYYATKYTDKKAEAVTTVFLDRVIGIYALTVMAAVAVLFNFNALWSYHAADGEAARQWWGATASQLLVVLTLVMCIVGSAAFFVLFSGVLRKSNTLVTLAKRLPFHRVIRKVHYALIAYKNHKMAVFHVFGLSVVLQSISVFGHWCFGLALGMSLAEVPLGSYFFLVPIGLVVNGLPLTPMGLGIGEIAFKILFDIVHCAKGAMIVLLFHLSQFLVGLVGLGYFIVGKKEYIKVIETAEADLG